MFHHFDHQMIGICVLSKSQAMRPELIIYALPLCWSTILYTCLLTNNCPHVRTIKSHICDLELVQNDRPIARGQVESNASTSSNLPVVLEP
jgi:hypothetical protein